MKWPKTLLSFRVQKKSSFINDIRRVSEEMSWSRRRLCISMHIWELWLNCGHILFHYKWLFVGTWIMKNRYETNHLQVNFTFSMSVKFLANNESTTKSMQSGSSYRQNDQWLFQWCNIHTAQKNSYAVGLESNTAENPMQWEQ